MSHVGNSGSIYRSYRPHTGGKIYSSCLLLCYQLLKVPTQIVRLQDSTDPVLPYISIPIVSFSAISKLTQGVNGKRDRTNYMYLYLCSNSLTVQSEQKRTFQEKVTGIVVSCVVAIFLESYGIRLIKLLYIFDCKSTWETNVTTNTTKTNSNYYCFSSDLERKSSWKADTLIKHYSTWGITTVWRVK